MELESRQASAEVAFDLGKPAGIDRLAPILQRLQR